MSLEIERSLRFGPRTAGEILTEINASQASFSRAVRGLEKTGRVLRLGRARATRYGLRRHLAGTGEDTWPLYTIDESGHPAPVAELTCIALDQFALRTTIPPESFPARSILREDFSPSLPFFFQQLRPEGFLGRAQLRTLDLDLDVPAAIRNWSEDHVLKFLVLRGEDLSGCWIVGQFSLERFLRQKYTIIDGTDGEIFADLARRALAGEAPGSSAGGEHPKFTALLRDAPYTEPYHAIVKFSSPANDPVAQRGRDLLRAEHQALEILGAAGFSVSPTRLLEFDSQIFLIVQRFDRVGERGRRPYIALGWLDDEFIGRRRNVRESAHRLQEQERITPQDCDTIQVASFFGDFIGNTDQHFGNTSFSWNNRGFFLAPLYDVLPMHYAPSALGQFRSDTHPEPVRFPEHADAYDHARILAERYWSQVQDDSAYSADFRSIAGRNAARYRK